MRAKDAVGRYGEKVAAAYLVEQGWQVLDRNWRGAAGELDIVALHGDELVVVEVKTRTGDGFGHPAEAVGRFRSALSLDPNSETAWVGLVTALREDGRPDAAERVVQTAPPALRPRLALPVDSSAAP